MEHNIKKLAKYAALVYEDLSRMPEVPTAVRTELAAPVGRLAKFLIPNCHQKLDEVVFASEHPGMRVNPHQHGADLFDADDNPVELKVSVVTQKNKHMAHFNWPVPGRGKVVEVRRAKLLASIDAKTKGGYAVLLVKNGRMTELARITLQHRFLKEYFARIDIGTCDKHLISAAQCKTCKKFHRLEKYAAASEQLEEHDDPAVVDWVEVMRVTPSQC